MCGITGVLNLTCQEPIDPDRLRDANNTLFHRGPDDEGIFVQSNVGLAARRLRIIDVAGGHQPISNEDGTAHIVYNGELYNYQDLKRQLESFGHRFRTTSDTEAVLHAYEQWGAEGSLKRLRGMYAFAIWNNTDRELFLARDRMGIKPLYFAEHGGRLFFASEIRGMLLHSNMPREVNVPALEAFMKVGFVSAPHSLFKGIRKLPPAHYLAVKNGGLSIHKYWELSYEETFKRSERDVVEEFRELLRECVEMHLMSEVPLGGLLSGGIDSAANVAIMQEIVQRPVKTVTIGFESAGYDEAEKAAATARALGTDHHAITFSGDAMDEYPKALYHREEPVARATFVAMYYLFKACRQQGLTVVLTGEGADELLGGYAWHRGDYLVSPFMRLPHFLRVALAASLMRCARGEWRRWVARVLREEPATVHRRYQAWMSIGDPDAGKSLLSSDVKSALDHNGRQPILESWAECLSGMVSQPGFHQMLWLQSRTRMADYINHLADRMSMAHSVEARPPFMDHKLWEFCATVPPSLKLNGSYFKQTEKYLLREASRSLLLPEGARIRKKKPLRVPYELWLSQSRLPDWAEVALSEAKLESTGLFDPAAVLKLRQEHQAGAPDRGTFLMGVLAIQTWAHMFLESPLAIPPQL